MRKQINLIKTVLIVLVSCFGLASMNGFGGSGDGYHGTAAINQWQVTSESPVIKEIRVSAPLTKKGFGDCWFSTWADDDSLFFTWGDGFGPNYPTELTYTHHGLAKASGPLPKNSSEAYPMEAVNLLMPYTNDMNSKPSSLLFYNGRLYAAIHMPLMSPSYGFIAYSDDYGKSFTSDPKSSPWTISNNSNFISMMFINMGKAYNLNTDGYVYAFGSRSECFSDGSIYLARVPKDKIIEYSAWTYFVALDNEGNPMWSSYQSAARPVANLESTWLLSSMYHPGIKRYLALTGNQIYGKFYDAPNPWGPWTLVNYWYNPELNSDLYTLCYMPGLITKDTGPDYFYFTTSGFDFALGPGAKYNFTLARIDMTMKQ